jgi:hypothetical protein
MLLTAILYEPRRVQIWHEGTWYDGWLSYKMS